MTKKDNRNNKGFDKLCFLKANNFNEKLSLLLKMLEYNTPYENEEHMFQFLPKGGFFDKKGNYFFITDENSKTLFCCHIDTVGRSKKKVEPIYENGWIRVGNKDAYCLGGDDRCGMLCLLTLIENKVPGTYIFHIGEEKGLIGARYIEKNYDLSKFERAIEFDRKGENSVIIEMGITKTCSDDFAEALCKELGMNFKSDDGGVSTDVKVYEDKIPECTNISVGYRNEHSTNEVINADFLINGLLPIIIKIDWEKLPTKRDPKANNRKVYNYSRSDYSSEWYHNKNNWEEDFLWDDYHISNDVRYKNNTIDNFTNHSKILRKNGVVVNNGDLINDSAYIECELCTNSEGPFKDINIAGTDYLLCEDCSSFLLEGWDSEEYNAEIELAEELDLLMLNYKNNNIEEEKEEGEYNE